MAKRDIILETIKAGGATRATLMEAAEVNEKGLSSQLTYLRWMGQCPMKQEDGTFKIVTTEEWEAHKAEVGTGFGSAAKTPKERLVIAEKRVKRASSALDNCKKRVEADDSKLNQLNFEKAKLELQISEIMESQAQKAVDEAPPEEEVEATEGGGAAEEPPEEVKATKVEKAEETAEEGEFL